MIECNDSKNVLNVMIQNFSNCFLITAFSVLGKRKTVFFCTPLRNPKTCQGVS
jgi:hypothetical protein